MTHGATWPGQVARVGRDLGTENLRMRIPLATVLVAIASLGCAAMLIAGGFLSSGALTAPAAGLVSRAPASQADAPACDDWAWWLARYQPCDR